MVTSEWRLTGEKLKIMEELSWQRVWKEASLEEDMEKVDVGLYDGSGYQYRVCVLHKVNKSPCESICGRYCYIYEQYCLHRDKHYVQCSWDNYTR